MVTEPEIIIILKTNKSVMSKTHYPNFMKGDVFAPSNIPNEPDDVPCKLELEHIYGSSRKGCKGDIFLMNSDDHLVYPSAACGVVYDFRGNKQKIFRNHEDDVKCIAMHPDGIHFATGECGKDDYIRIWNSQTMELVSSIRSFEIFTGGGVLALSFSSNGKWIAAVGGPSLAPILVIYGWELGTVLCRSQLPKKRTFGIFFNPRREGEMVWIGKNECRFLTYYNNTIDSRKAVIASKGGSLQSFYTVFFDDLGDAHIGTKDGCIYSFKKNTLAEVKKISNKSIFCSERTEKGFWTGGKDGVLRYFQWGVRNKRKFKQVREIEMKHGIGSLAMTNDEKLLFTWGIYNGLLKKVDLETNEAETVLNAHSGLAVTTELWGLDVFKDGSGRFISAGDDGRVFIYSKLQRKVLAAVRQANRSFRSVSIHPDGKTFVCGTKKGHVLVWSVEGMNSKSEPLKVFRCGPEEISVLKFSPDGKRLAIGSHDNHIYLYTTKNFNRVHIFKGHNSYVTGLDFSVNSDVIQSSSGDYELLFWDVSQKSRILRPSEAKDVVFVPFTSLLGWPVRGMWNMDPSKKKEEHQTMDGTDINGCCGQGGVLVSADDYGTVAVMKFPTTKNHPMIDRYIGHCSHVTRAMITPDQKHVLTTGGGDLTIFQWKIV